MLYLLNLTLLRRSLIDTLRLQCPLAPSATLVATLAIHPLQLATYHNPHFTICGSYFEVQVKYTLLRHPFANTRRTTASIRLFASRLNQILRTLSSNRVGFVFILFDWHILLYCVLRFVVFFIVLLLLIRVKWARVVVTFYCLLVWRISAKVSSY